MMEAVDIRECNRLEKNASRLDKARKLVDMAIKTNELSDLQLRDVSMKLEIASKKMREVRSSIIRKHDRGF
jgi:hypothetical protein